MRRLSQWPQLEDGGSKAWTDRAFDTLVEAFYPKLDLLGFVLVQQWMRANVYLVARQKQNVRDLSCVLLVPSWITLDHFVEVGGVNESGQDAIRLDGATPDTQ